MVHNRIALLNLHEVVEVTVNTEKSTVRTVSASADMKCANRLAFFHFCYSMGPMYNQLFGRVQLLVLLYLEH